MALFSTLGNQLPPNRLQNSLAAPQMPGQLPATPVAPAVPVTPLGPTGNYVQPGTTSLPSPHADSPTPPFADRNYNEMVGGSLQYFLNPNSQYIQNARQRGMEIAATRGGINSTIAAGAAERQALDAAGNLAQGAVQAKLGQEQVQLQNWIDTQGFNRELASMPYRSSMDMLERVMEYGLQDPQLYTPSVISGFSNFFNQNMNDILGRYFGNG